MFTMRLENVPKNDEEKPKRYKPASWDGCGLQFSHLTYIVVPKKKKKKPPSPTSLLKPPFQHPGLPRSFPGKGSAGFFPPPPC